MEIEKENIVENDELEVVSIPSSKSSKKEQNKEEDYTEEQKLMFKRMLKDHEQKKREAARLRRAASRSTNSSSNNESKKRSAQKSLAQSLPKKMRQELAQFMKKQDQMLKIKKLAAEEKKAKKTKEEKEESNEEEDNEDGIDSTDPEDDEIISLGDDEKDYQRRKEERKLRTLKAVPLALLDRANILKIPRVAHFLQFCQDCKQAHFKREEGIMFKTDQDDLNILPIKMCADCLNKNIQLNMSYNRHWNQSVNNHCEVGQNISYVFRGENITGAGDEKLLNLKYAWCLHQCHHCAEKQKNLAVDVFLEKSGNDYELNFLVCQYCSIANKDLQSSINRLYSTFGGGKK